MKLKLLLSTFLMLFFVLSVSYAGVGTAVSLHNDEIDQENRNFIHELNNKIIESIKNGDSSVMLNLFMDDVRNQPGLDTNIKNLYLQLNELFKNTNFNIENEYLVTVKSLGGFNPVILSETKDAFSMVIEGKSDQIYISLLTSEGDFKNFMLSFIFMKIKNKWKLYSFNAGVSKIAGKSAISWFNEAKQLYDKGYLLPAALRLQVLQESLRPAPFIQYEKEPEVMSLGNKIQGDINQKYKFPIRVADIKTSPEIYYIEPQFLKSELLPLVKYVSSIPLTNTVELQKEAESMTPELDLIFPGITKGVNNIVYRAFSEAPTDPKKQYQFYGLVVEVK